jgi:tetratricopeptide (TPR) repeat protein
LLRRLSVFSGGWTTEAGEAVCSGGDIEQWEVVDLLGSLVEKSLVVLEPTGRYRLLETIRQYARDRLFESQESERWREQHMRWALELATSAEAHLLGPTAAQWFGRLDAEHDNLRSAMDWCDASLDAGEQGLRFCSALMRFWYRGHFREGSDYCLRALKHPGAQQRTMWRARALEAASCLVWGQNEHGTVKDLVQEALDVARETGDRFCEMRCLMSLAPMVDPVLGWEGVMRLHAEALAISRELKNEQEEALILNNTAVMLRYRGELAQARELCEQALAINRRLGISSRTALSSGVLASIVQAAGDYALARQMFLDSLPLVAELKDRKMEAIARYQLAAIARDVQDFDAASAYALESMQINREIGVVDPQFAVAMGTIQLARGDLQGAREWLSKALPDLDRSGDVEFYILALEAVGELAWAEKRAECAAIAAGAALKLRRETYMAVNEKSMPTYRAAMESVRGDLGQVRFDQLVEQGSVMEPADALLRTLNSN